MSLSLTFPTASQVTAGALTQATLNAILADFLAAQAALGGSAGTVVGTGVAQIAHATFNFAVDGGGAPGLITPAANFTLPINAIVIGQVIDWTTPGVGVSNTTSIGLSGAGGGAAVLLAATAVASLTGIVQGLIVQQTASGFKKITAAGGQLTLTTAVAALTAGVCEVYVFYIASSS